MFKYALLKFSAVIIVIVIITIICAQFVFSQVGYKIQDKDGFVNLRIKPNKKSNVIIKIPNGKCVIEGYRRGEWCKVMYFKEKEKELYGGYVHASRMIRDATCEEILARNNIGECEIKDLKFDYDGTFKTLFDWFNEEYLVKCDDASYAEGISDFVVTRLASDWGDSINELKRNSDNKNYLEFVLKHIDASCDENDLKKILNLASQCMFSEKSEICRRIFDAAKSANDEVRYWKGTEDKSK